MSIKRIDLSKLFPLASGLLVFIIYLFTLAPSVIQIDSGELAAVQATLGIAHPTGYPLFTVLGFLFQLIPIPVTTIYKLNLLSSVWSALAVATFSVFVFDVLKYVLSKQSVNKREKSKETTINQTVLIFISVGSALIMGLGKTFWMQSTSVEVYSLQTFLFSLILLFSFRGFSNTVDKNYWIICAFVIGLSFSNHMTTILTLPLVIGLWYIQTNHIGKKLNKLLFFIVIVILTAGLFYSYLPLRSVFQPYFNWGNPINFENFLRHISGKQYQIWLFSSFESAQKQFSFYVSNFRNEFVYTGIIIGLTGIVRIAILNFKLAMILISTFLISILYTINYDIADIDSYFLFSFMIFSLFVSFGLVYLFIFLFNKIKNETATISLILSFAILPQLTNYNAVNQRSNYVFEDYTKLILNSVEPNSLIFSYQWDYFISPSYYFQKVENYRNDVIVIDKELLRRSWYLNQLENNYPELSSQIEKVQRPFIKSLKPFEAGEPFNAELIEQNYRRLMTKIVESRLPNSYIGIELIQNEMSRGEFNLPEGYTVAPHIFLFKVIKEGEYLPAPDPNFSIRFIEKNDRYTEFIRNTIAGMLIYRSMYEIQFNNIAQAKKYIQKVRKEFPEINIPNDLLQKINQTIY